MQRGMGMREVNTAPEAPAFLHAKRQVAVIQPTGVRPVSRRGTGCDGAQLHIGQLLSGFRLYSQAVTAVVRQVAPEDDRIFTRRQVALPAADTVATERFDAQQFTPVVYQLLPEVIDVDRQLVLATAACIPIVQAGIVGTNAGFISESAA